MWWGGGSGGRVVVWRCCWCWCWCAATARNVRSRRAHAMEVRRRVVRVRRGERSAVECRGGGGRRLVHVELCDRQWVRPVRRVEHCERHTVVREARVEREHSEHGRKSDSKQERSRLHAVAEQLADVPCRRRLLGVRWGGLVRIRVARRHAQQTTREVRWYLGEKLVRFG